MKSTAIDTNIAINLLKKEIGILRKYQHYDFFYLPVTVCGELLYGAFNSENSEKNLSVYRDFITNCELLEINYTVAERYAKIRKELKDKGTPIPENDIWIAATCLSNNISLATNDRHFKNIEGLRLS